MAPDSDKIPRAARSIAGHRRAGLPGAVAGRFRADLLAVVACVGFVQALSGCSPGRFNPIAAANVAVHAGEQPPLSSDGRGAPVPGGRGTPVLGGHSAPVETVSRPGRPDRQRDEPQSPITFASPTGATSPHSPPISEPNLSAGRPSIDTEPRESGFTALVHVAATKRPGVVEGTEPGGAGLDMLPRDNRDAADLLDHWGHRRMQSIVDGLSLGAPDAEADAAELRSLMAAARTHEGEAAVPDLHDEDAVQLLGSRRGIDYGRWTGGPADTLSIEFDLSGAGSTVRNIPEFRPMLERAGKSWSRRIADTWEVWERPAGDVKGWLVTDVDPRVEVRVGAGGELSTGLEIDVRDANLDGANAWSLASIRSPGDSWQPRFGSIEVDRQYLRSTYEARLFSTLAHEIGHILGAWMGGSRTERYAPYTDTGAGTWTGPNVTAVHGAPAPFQDASDRHAWIDGERSPLATRFDFAHSGVCASLMANCRHGGAERPIRPHAIDFAFLSDLGMTITEDADRPETYGLAGWTDYAGFSLSVARDLQVTFADPQPHYLVHPDGGDDHWRTLDVTDLLHVGADAFGYRTTRVLGGPFSTDPANGTVTYAGGLLGAALDRAGLPPVTGDATLAVDLATLDGTASFTSLEVHSDGTPEVLAGGSLHYPFELSNNAIVGTRTDSTLRADFYGPEHEEIAGVLHDPRASLLASFGATVDGRPGREAVVDSADYLMGTTYQRGSADAADDGWYRFRCRTSSDCASQHAGSTGWTDWTTAIREDVLAATAGWDGRHTSRLESDHGFVRITRQSAASTDGRQGRHVVDSYFGTMEHAVFGAGFEKYTSWTEESSDTSTGLSEFYNVWSGFQGVRSGPALRESATWSGPMLGYHGGHSAGDDPFVEGVATVEFSLFDYRVDVAFSDVASRDGQRDFGDFGFGNLRVAGDGTFSGGGSAGILEGGFFGPFHQETAGSFHHNATSVTGGFGARRLEEAASPTGRTSNPDLAAGGSDAVSGPGASGDGEPRGGASSAGRETALGTEPGSLRLAERPRDNPDAEDLLDHWGHRRVRSVVDRLSLGTPDTGADGADLKALVAAAQASEAVAAVPDLHDGDTVRVLGSRRGIDYGRWTGGPADTLSIELDVSRAGRREMRDNPQFRALLERAGKAWSHRIADTWTAWERPAGDRKGWLIDGDRPDIEVRVGVHGETSTGLEIDIKDEDIASAGWANNWATNPEVLPPGDSWQPRFGSLEIDREYLRDATEASLYATLVHEIGHVMGAWQGEHGTERYASHTDRQAGTWTGPNVAAVHGGPAPFQDGSDPHSWVDGERSPTASQIDFAHSGVCTSIMAYCRNNAALRAFAPHAIDYAFLSDLGMMITEDTDRPETYGLAGWTDYAGFSLSVARDLQVTFADPQPHYDGAANHWHTFDVTDLLHVGADAFGYRTTRVLGGPFSTDPANGTVTYAGGLLGAALDRAGLPPVTGDATLAVNLATLNGTASFTSLEVHSDGTPALFAGGSLHYPFELSNNAIVGTRTDSTLRADFYGPEHEEIAGVLHDPRASLLASFGATVDGRPGREAVVDSADYLMGTTYQLGSADADDGWYRFRCRTSSDCASQHAGTTGWTDWTTAIREDVLAATAGWDGRGRTRLLEDGRAARIARQWNASTDGARGRHVVDGFTGTMEFAAFGVGTEESSSEWMGSNGTPPGFSDIWTGFQGSLADSSPTGNATWTGTMVGHQRYGIPEDESPFVRGLATVVFSLPESTVDVAFSDIASLDGRRPVPDFRFDDVALEDDGSFSRTGGSARLWGALFGPSHEEVAGMFDQSSPRVLGSFGAVRLPDGAPAEQDAFTATRVPTVDLDGTRHIGADVAPEPDALTSGRERNRVTISFGEVQDGESAARVIEYLTQHIDDEGRSGSLTPGLPTLSEPPVVRLAEGTSDAFAAYVEHTVQLINTALPVEKRIALSPEPAPPLTALADVPEGRIFIDFAPSKDDWELGDRYRYPWTDYDGAPVMVAEADPTAEHDTAEQRWEHIGMRAGRIWFDREVLETNLNTARIRDWDTGEWRTEMLEHRPDESDSVRHHYPDGYVTRMTMSALLRALGLLRRVDSADFPESFLRDGSVLPIRHLPGIDGEALFAAYDRLAPGTLPEDLSAESLGPWEDTSFHLRGDLDLAGGEAAFGVAIRNGLARPWAFGPKPLASLAGNTALSGTVTWNGALAGITPAEQTVSGDARLAVELATLQGQLDFTGLERWGERAAPGTAGRGTTWGDGDLGYSVRVEGNALVQTGGDEGEVTGAFLGRAHEAMGGVLQRDDLSAGFGGER